MTYAAFLLQAAAPLMPYAAARVFLVAKGAYTLRHPGDVRRVAAVGLMVRVAKASAGRCVADELRTRRCYYGQRRLLQDAVWRMRGGCVTDAALLLRVAKLVTCCDTRVRYAASL